MTAGLKHPVRNVVTDLLFTYPIYSLSKYLLSISYVLSTVFGIGDVRVHRKGAAVLILSQVDGDTEEPIGCYRLELVWALSRVVPVERWA